jgi:hypothetical protein
LRLEQQRTAIENNTLQVSGVWLKFITDLLFFHTIIFCVLSVFPFPFWCFVLFYRTVNFWKCQNVQIGPIQWICKLRSKMREFDQNSGRKNADAVYLKFILNLMILSLFFYILSKNSIL